MANRETSSSTKPGTVLSRDQRRRAEALEHARRIILGTVGGPLVVRVANGPCDADDVLRVAGWILDGIVEDVVDAGVIGYDPAERLDDIRRAGTLREAVGIAVGAASTCWERLDGTGVFDSTFASQITDALLERAGAGIDVVVEEDGPVVDGPRLDREALLERVAALPRIDNLGPSIVFGPELFGCVTPEGVVSQIAYRGVWYAPAGNGADIPDDMKPLDPGLFPRGAEERTWAPGDPLPLPDITSATYPVVDGPRPTLETAGLGYVSETVLEDRYVSAVACRKGCVDIGPHVTCVDVIGEPIG